MSDITKEQKTKLFQDYFQAEEALTKTKQAMDTATELRSLTVKAILDALGRGPFQIRGKVVTIVARSSKNDDPTGEAPVNYFFKSVGKQEIEKIDV